jgi:hypothetical protein
MNQTINHITNSSAALPKVTRMVSPALGIGLFVTVGPIIAQAIHSAAIVLFELGRLSSLAVQIFCN